MSEWLESIGADLKVLDPDILEDVRAALNGYLSDAADTDALSARLDTDADPRELRSRALVTIRCKDCRGQIIAHLTIIEARPVLWVRGEDQAGSRVYVPAESRAPLEWGDYAHCRARVRYPVPFAAVREIARDANGRHAVLTVGHSRPTAANVRY